MRALMVMLLAGLTLSGTALASTTGGTVAPGSQPIPAGNAASFSTLLSYRFTATAAVATFQVRYRNRDPGGFSALVCSQVRSRTTGKWVFHACSRNLKRRIQPGSGSLVLRVSVSRQLALATCRTGRMRFWSYFAIRDASFPMASRTSTLAVGPC